MAIIITQRSAFGTGQAPQQITTVLCQQACELLASGRLQTRPGASVSSTVMYSWARDQSHRHRLLPERAYRSSLGHRSVAVDNALEQWSCRQVADVPSSRIVSGSGHGAGEAGEGGSSGGRHQHLTVRELARRLWRMKPGAVRRTPACWTCRPTPLRRLVKVCQRGRRGVAVE